MKLKNQKIEIKKEQLNKNLAWGSLTPIKD